MNDRAPRRAPRSFAGLALTTALALTVPAWSAPGDVDPTFDGGSAGYGSAALTSSGRIVAACLWNAPPGSPCREHFSVARILPHGGALDLSFGDRGIGRLPWGFAPGPVAVQSDDAVVVGSADGEAAGFSLARLTPAGALDESFGEAGVARLGVGPDGGFVTRLAVQPDDRIVAVGCVLEVGDLIVARVLPDGSPDPEFAGGRVVVEDVSGPSDKGSCRGASVALQADGKIVVAGHASYGFGVLRYLPSGARDPSFGDDGLVLALGGGPGNPHAVPSNVRIDAAGRVVVGGSTDGAYGTVVLARFLSDGRPDPTFGSTGTLGLRLAPTYWDRLGPLAVQPDGRILLGTLGVDAARIVRLEDDGRRDESFASAGVLALPTSSALHTLLLEPGGGRTVGIGLSALYRVLLQGEPCPDGAATIRRASLHATSLAPIGVGGYDALDVAGLVVLPEGVGFDDLDPARDGMRIVVEGPDGVRIDETLAARTYAPGSLGWRRAGGGKKWVYRNDVVPRSGITRVSIKDRSRGGRGLLRVTLMGRRATYAVTAAPLTVSLDLDGSSAPAAGTCGQRTLAPEACTKSGLTLSCGS